MDYDSPEVMKDFPGLYAAEKRKGNDSDYNDDNEKATKKEMIIGKRKEKKDKKDRDKGYAALEGESSDEASPCKAKKSKAFKFSKSKEKEKEHPKDKAECSSKSRQKTKKSKHPKFSKGFGTKFVTEGATQALAEALPIFGADLEAACERGKCHDGVCVPLPVRECIDYVEAKGMTMENVYKISAPKNKVHQIRKMYNNRQPVNFREYDVPTATSVLKTFLRDLPEPIIPNELLVRFEEAGAILNYNTRSKHLSSLVAALPPYNRRLLIYLMCHLYNVTQKAQVNRMNRQNLAQALNHVFRISSRLLQGLIMHRISYYPEFEVIKYFPPLQPGAPYPEDPDVIMVELCKLGSALDLIHWEMQQGFFSDERQDQLWEVQRIQTDLKRKLKKEFSQPQQTLVSEENDDQTMNSQPAGEEEEGEEGEEEDITESERPAKTVQDQAEEPPCMVIGLGYLKDYKRIKEANIQRQRLAAACMEAGDQQEGESDIDSDENEGETVDEPMNQMVDHNYSVHSEMNNPGYHRRSTEQNSGNVSVKGVQNVTLKGSSSNTSCEKTSNSRHPIIVSGLGCQSMPANLIIKESVGLNPAAGLSALELPEVLRNQLKRLEPPRQSVETNESEYVQENEDSMQEGACSANSEQECMSISEQEEQEEDSETDFAPAESQYLAEYVHYDTKLYNLQAKNDILMELIESLSSSIKQEKDEIKEYKKKVDAMSATKTKKAKKFPRDFDEVRGLLIRENHMLEIKKVQLVRQIMEYREQCVELKAMKRFANREFS